MQYMLFILLMHYTGNNALVFPQFSTEANFDLKQQARFVAIAWCLNLLVYEATNVMCKRLFNLTPLYVGEAVLRESDELQMSLIFIAGHIISDVYLSMLLGMEGGIYFARTTDTIEEYDLIPLDTSGST